MDIDRYQAFSKNPQQGKNITNCETFQILQYIYRVRQKKCINTLTKKTLRCIIDYCKSTICFRQYNNMIYVFTSI